MPNLSETIATIEANRDSRVVVLAASNLDLELLPMLFETLHATGDVPRLDVLLHVRGGAIDAARRIGLLLASASEQLGVIVPFYCQSAGTIVALAAQEIVAGPLAIFSPIDPQLQAAVGDGIGALSSEDIRRYPEMARAWFDQEGPQAASEAFTALSHALFPPTLTAFYRADEEVAIICRELLALHMEGERARLIEPLVAKLMHGFPSHTFPLSGHDLAALGLPIARHGATEASAEVISRMLRSSVGGGARAGEQDDWFDACIATRDSCQLRRIGPGLMMPVWESGRIDS